MPEATAIPLLDYDKLPAGYAIEEDSADPPSGKHGSYLRDAADKETLWESTWTTWAGACAAAWTHVRANNDPPGTIHCGPLRLFVTFGPGLPRFLSRTEIWAYYDRCRAIAIDLAEQVGDPPQAERLLSNTITLSDAECEEVERYAALPFPRSVDMPEPLQRALLPGASC